MRREEELNEAWPPPAAGTDGWSGARLTTAGDTVGHKPLMLK